NTPAPPCRRPPGRTARRTTGLLPGPRQWLRSIAPLSKHPLCTAVGEVTDHVESHSTDVRHPHNQRRPARELDHHLKYLFRAAILGEHQLQRVDARLGGRLAENVSSAAYQQVVVGGGPLIDDSPQLARAVRTVGPAIEHGNPFLDVGVALER